MIGFAEDLIGADRKDTFGECDTRSLAVSGSSLEVGGVVDC